MIRLFSRNQIAFTLAAVSVVAALYGVHRAFPHSHAGYSIVILGEFSIWYYLILGLREGIAYRPAGAPGPAPGTIRVPAFLWSGAWGLVFAWLWLVTLDPPTGMGLARIPAGIAVVALYVLMARGAFSRYMAPADTSLVGGPVAKALGGPGSQPLTPQSAAYGGLFAIGAAVAIQAYFAHSPADAPFGSRFATLFGGLGAIGVLYGILACYVVGREHPQPQAARLRRLD